MTTMTTETMAPEAAALSVEVVRRALRRVVAGDALTRDEARELFSTLLLAEVPSALAGGLLSALAQRGESVEELLGAIDVLRANALATAIPTELAGRAVDVCGTGGDGRGTFNVSTTVAFVVAGAGVPVAKHGGRAVSSSCGSADVLGALGIEVEMTPELAGEALARAGVTFLFAPVYHRAMKNVAALRRELGIRTLFNLAGPLCNPAGVARQVVGVDRPARIGVVAEALRRLGAAHAFVLSNEKGGDELLPFGTTEVAEVQNGVARRFTLTASDFGLAEGDPEHLAGGDGERNAEILRGILDGEVGTRRETVLMNAAAALVISGRVEDLKDGVAMAAASIDSGAARRALLSFAALSRASRSAADEGAGAPIASIERAE